MGPTEAVPTVLEVSVDGGPVRRIAHGPIVIGRAEAEIVVNHVGVSRRHATIQWNGGYWEFVDAGSTNGTYRAGQRITSVPVVGDEVFVLGVDGDSPRLRIRQIVSTPDPHIANDVQPRTGWTTSRRRLHSSGDRRIAIGRDPIGEVVLTDLMVSREHALVVITGPEAVLHDLRSANGTFVDGHRIDAPVLLVDGQEFTINTTQLRYESGRVQVLEPDDTVLQTVGARVVTDDGITRLRDINLVVKRRQLVAVVGPSGAGKSTLLGILTGTRKLAQGEVHLAGRSLASEYDELRQQIGYVPQQDIVHPQLTPRQILSYAAQLRLPPDVTAAERVELVGEVISRLGLVEAADRPVNRLSGGQRKRVNVALELLTKPPIMFLDEPTSGLDPGHDKALMRQLRELADDGRAIMVVTHNVSYLDLCDAVLVLAPGGRRAYFGSPAGALAAFSARDFAEVFEALERDTDREWESTTTRRAAAATPIHVTPAPPATQTGHPWSQRLLVLTRRYARIIATDRRNLLLMLIQAPILGLLARAVGGAAGVAPGDDSLNSYARRTLFTLVLFVTWLGASNAIREIVKERAIFDRERLIDIPIGAYLGSKLVVLAALSAIQSVVLVAVALGGRPGPAHPIWFLPGDIELTFALWLGGMASTCLALLISALVTRTDKAMTLLPLLLVPQFVLCGGVLPLRQVPALKPISYLASSRWDFALAASTTDLRSTDLTTRRALANPVPPDRIAEIKSDDDDPLWRREQSIWLIDAGALVTMCGLSMAGAGLALNRVRSEGDEA